MEKNQQRTKNEYNWKNEVKNYSFLNKYFKFFLLFRSIMLIVCLIIKISNSIDGRKIERMNDNELYKRTYGNEQFKIDNSL
jgi:hypothetical protein